MYRSKKTSVENHIKILLQPVFKSLHQVLRRIIFLEKYYFKNLFIFENIHVRRRVIVPDVELINRFELCTAFPSLILLKKRKKKLIVQIKIALKIDL